MKPTPEQVAAAKAYVRGTETPMQYALLRGSCMAIPQNYVAMILLTALEAAEQDSARLDWLNEHKGSRPGNCDRDSQSYYVIHFPSGYDYYKGGKDLPLREAIDAARKAQP